MSYQPELGQMLFGQPHKQFAGSNLLEAALRRLDYALETVMWNINQEEYSSPFNNTGNSFKCDKFEVHAYSWGGDEQPFNFKWRDVEVSWYKWCGRGLTVNQELPSSTISEMLDDCLDAIIRYENSDEAKAAVEARHAVGTPPVTK